MKATRPPRVAICGIGGFAALHHRSFAALERSGRIRVVATCDPAMERLGDSLREFGFAERGVAVHAGFEAMMERHRGEIDLGVVATPIACHAPMHRALVEAGAACYLEKPPTLDPREFEAMVEADRSARLPTHVGFSYIYLPDRLALKRRMVEGEFGAPLEFSFLGLLPRTAAYYARNNWAGRLRLGDSLVLDSCLGNAMAHFLNAMLFWAGGGGVRSRARPAAMESELYRANPIEGCDTVFASCLLDNGATLRLAATHACGRCEPVLEERMVFENATVFQEGGRHAVIAWRNGRTERFGIEAHSLDASLAAYLEFYGSRDTRPAQSLEDCRGFVEANALLYIAAGAIHTVDSENLDPTGVGDALGIADVGRACRLMAERGIPPSRSGMAWGRPGGGCSIGDLSALGGIVSRLASTRHPGHRASMI